MFFIPSSQPNASPCCPAQHGSSVAETQHLAHLLPASQFAMIYWDRMPDLEASLLKRRSSGV
jgi:hypothetical protein